jgi:hypothetical protein
MTVQTLSLVMITGGWLLIYLLEKKKGISKTVFNIFCGLSFTLNILGAVLCIIALISSP